MTDDEILKKAEQIKMRRLNEARFASFKKQKMVMIRWQNDRKDVPSESYTSIMVEAHILRNLVEDALILENSSVQDS